MANNVFISYSRRDLAFVSQLHQELTQRGVSAWFDQSEIEAGDQWREEIVKGIEACNLFLPVLSPDSLNSKNVRKEISLAEDHNKQIVPLRWRKSDLPPSVQYQLAGIQYFEFDEEASKEKFDRLTAILNKLLGGASLAEAAPNEAVFQAEGVAAPQPAVGPARRGRRRRGNAQKEGIIAAGTLVMTKVVAQLNDFTSEEQDAINQELKWLFVAAEHFSKIRRGEVDAAAPVPVPIPPEAERTAPNANNALLPDVDDFTIQLIEGEINSLVKQIIIYSRNLTIELNKQAMLGGEAASNIALLNSIKAQQRGMIERTQDLARTMKQVYGVLVYGPEDVLDVLK